MHPCYTIKLLFLIEPQIFNDRAPHTQYFYKMTIIVQMLKQNKWKTACEERKHLYYSYSFGNYDIGRNECCSQGQYSRVWPRLYKLNQNNRYSEGKAVTYDYS